VSEHGAQELADRLLLRADVSRPRQLPVVDERHVMRVNVNKNSLAVFMAIALGCGAVASGVLQARAAAQVAAESVYSGSKMTRPQIMDKLASPQPGTTVSLEKGRALFEKLCAGCHIFGETGASVGPDLTTLASRFGRRDVLDAILWPSKTISDQYAVTVLQLADGTYASGVIVREDRQYLYLKNAEYIERPLPVAAANVKERTESTVSLMPEGLVEPLTLDEIDSLVRYSLSGR
jgi:putative heme-binding domain-containing protein